MIDINPGEILVLVVLAVIIFGPDKLPELARKLARVFNYLRGIANDARGQLREELGPEFADLHLSDLNPRSLGTRLLGEDATRELAEVRNELGVAGQAVGAAVAPVPSLATPSLAAAAVAGSVTSPGLPAGAPSEPVAGSASNPGLMGAPPSAAVPGSASNPSLFGAPGDATIPRAEVRFDPEAT